MGGCGVGGVGGWVKAAQPFERRERCPCVCVLLLLLLLPRGMHATNSSSCPALAPSTTDPPALLPPPPLPPQVDLPVFYGNKMRRKMKAGAGCEDLRVRCPHYYRVATALHAAMVATLTADEDFPAFILNTFRNRYKVGRIIVRAGYAGSTCSSGAGQVASAPGGGGRVCWGKGPACAGSVTVHLVLIRPHTHPGTFPPILCLPNPAVTCRSC